DWRFDGAQEGGKQLRGRMKPPHGGQAPCRGRFAAALLVLCVVALACADSRGGVDGVPQWGVGAGDLSSAGRGLVGDARGGARLGLGWTAPGLGVSRPGGVPAVAGGEVFVGVDDPGNPPTTPGSHKLFAFDAESGSVLWNATLGAAAQTTVPAAAGGRVFI